MILRKMRFALTFALGFAPDTSSLTREISLTYESFEWFTALALVRKIRSNLVMPKVTTQGLASSIVDD